MLNNRINHHRHHLTLPAFHGNCLLKNNIRIMENNSKHTIMKTYVYQNTAASYGGVCFHGSLRYFDKYIGSVFQQKNFTSSFEELELILSYPPLYILPEIADLQKSFMEYYQTLPYSRLDRRYKKIEVSIRAPEFSEHIEKTEKAQDEQLARALSFRKERQLKTRPKTRLIRDLRVYTSGLPQKAFYPFDFQYSEIFLNILMQKGLLCPVYHHLYIRITPTREEALKNSIAGEDWFVYGIAAVDFMKYKSLSESEKAKYVFELICTGIRDIAEIDKLDNSIIEDTINEIRKKGLDTELFFKRVENNLYTLTVSYFSKSMEEKSPVFFSLTDKKTGKTVKKQIGKADNSQIHPWLQKINLTNKLIKVTSSKSSKPDVWLKGLPRNMEFDITEFMKE